MPSTHTRRPSPAWKRALDVGLAGLGLLLGAPLWALIAAAVKLEDGGPVLYRQERVGKAGRPFGVAKFRTLRPDNDVRPGTGPPPEAAVNRVGRLLRATALDELPQLLNILRGEMSFVGPRPLTLEQVTPSDPEAPEPGARPAAAAAVGGPHAHRRMVRGGAGPAAACRSGPRGPGRSPPTRLPAPRARGGDSRPVANRASAAAQS